MLYSAIRLIAAAIGFATALTVVASASVPPPSPTGLRRVRRKADHEQTEFQSEQTRPSEELQHWYPINSSMRIQAANRHSAQDSLRLTPVLDRGNPFAYSQNGRVAQASGAASIENALGPGQDPSPLSRIENGERVYYFPTIDFQNGVYMQTSTNLNDVLSVKSNEHSVYNFTQNIGTEAPGIFQWGPNDYLMYISSVGQAGNANMFVLHNDGKDLLSNWQEVGRVAYADGAALQNYDAMPFLHPNGKRYLLYSGLWHVSIAELTGFNTLQPRAQETLVYASPNQSFVVEAPGVAIIGDTLNVYWSENAYFKPDYNVQNLAVPLSADPLESTTWSARQKSVVLQSSNETGVYGPGSAATFVGPDEKPWIALTCFYNPNGFDQTKVNPRRVQVQPMHYNESGALLEIIPSRPVRYTDQ